MDLENTIRTTASLREFSSSPPPQDLIYQALELARFAPSGGNRQGWRVIVIRDAETRLQIAAHYLETWEHYVEKWYAGDLTADRQRKLDEANRFAASVSEIPVHLAVWVDMQTLEITDAHLDRPSVVAGGSIFPFVQNFTLACRSLGLGTRVTTLLSSQESVLRRLLAVPDFYALAAVILVGKPLRQITKLSRHPVEEFATLDSYDGPPLSTGADPGPTDR